MFDMRIFLPDSITIEIVHTDISPEDQALLDAILERTRITTRRLERLDRKT